MLTTLNKLIIFFLAFVFNLSLNAQIIAVKVYCGNGKETIPFVTIKLFKNDVLVSTETTDINGGLKFKDTGTGSFKIISEKTGCKDTTVIEVITDKIHPITLHLSCEKATCNETVSASDRLEMHGVHFDSITVRQYVNLLSRNNNKTNFVHPILIETPAPVNWIKKADIPYLLTLIESEQAANCVMKMISSQLPTGKSTLGGQVMNLIDAYRHGSEYPAFLTDCSTSDKRRAEEIRKWWNGVH